MALYHSAKGSVNYTVVGSPTIVEGVVSNFSSSNYLQLSNQVSLGSNFEILTKVNTATLNDSCIIFSGKTGTYINCGYYSTTSVMQYNIGNGSSWSVPSNQTRGTTTISSNSTYYIKFTFDGNIYKAFISIDRTNWVLDWSFSSQDIIPSCDIVLGVSRNIAQPFQGSIDLNETYITVNGQPWFGVCPIEVKEHQLMGPVGYTVVGSPTISNGVVSGFSVSNYLETSYSFTNDNFELKIKFETGASVSDNQNLFYTRGCQFYIIGWARSLGIRYNTTGETSVYCDGASNKLVPNTTYFAKLVYNKQSSIIIYLSTDDNYYEKIAETLPTKLPSISGGICTLGASGTSYFFGSIDLNSTYIKVNGKLWFYQPAPTKYIIKDNSLVFADQGLYLTGPVTYEKVGSPTIVDGVASDFSASNYLKTTNTLSSGNFSSLEAQFKIKTGSSISVNSPVIFCTGNPYWFAIRITDNNRMQFLYRKEDNSAYVELRPWYTIQTDTVYVLKINYTPTQQQAEIYNESGTLLDRISQNNTCWLNPQALGNTYIGAAGGSPYWSGSIDLKETYIKVDDQLWFYGKNYATKNIAPVPANYTYGTTTTPSIGYVDMRTQAFTAAPTGATIGRDE